MGEGVDPTQMCQSLVDKVAQSKQLMAIADPDLLVLFEDWLEELEARGAHAFRGARGFGRQNIGRQARSVAKRGEIFTDEAAERRETTHRG
jgi:hypothetical protein